MNRTPYINYIYNSLQEPIADPPTGLPESDPLPPLQRQLACGTPLQEQVQEPQCGQGDFNQEQGETVQAESVDADTDAEGEEQSKDIEGGVYAAGASPATGEQDGAEGHGKDLPSSKVGVDNQQAQNSLSYRKIFPSCQSLAC